MLKLRSGVEEDFIIDDSASLLINQMLRVEPSVKAPSIWGPNVLARREYFKEKTRFMPADDVASLSVIWFSEPPSSASTAFLFARGAYEANDIDALVDEPLEPIPLKIQPVKLILRYVGRGEPVLQSDTELILFDED